MCSVPRLLQFRRNIKDAAARESWFNQLRKCLADFKIKKKNDEDYVVVDSIPNPEDQVPNLTNYILQSAHSISNPTDAMLNPANPSPCPTDQVPNPAYSISIPEDLFFIEQVLLLIQQIMFLIRHMYVDVIPYLINYFPNPYNFGYKF